jgi:hypothetical protein
VASKEDPAVCFGAERVRYALVIVTPSVNLPSSALLHEWRASLPHAAHFCGHRKLRENTARAAVNSAPATEEGVAALSLSRGTKRP